MTVPVLSCVNLKGGVGKTAISVNFSIYCASVGLKTLIVDLDPQTNATFSLVDIDEWEEHARNHGTVANLLGARKFGTAEGKEKTANDVIMSDVRPNLDLLPSHLDLFTIDLDLGSEVARERKLRKALADTVDNYDIIVCDCPPNLTIPTQNAIALSTHYVVPISPDYLSGIGVGLLLNRIGELSEAMEHELDHVGIVISRVGRPAIHREQTVEALRTQFGDLVFRQTLTERVKVSECAATKQSIYESTDRVAAEEFSRVSKRILKRMGVEHENA